MARFERIREEALRLTRRQRLQLAQELQASVMTAQERQVEQAWIAEAQRRMQAFEDGTAELIPGDQVLRELRAKYAAPKRRRTR